MCAFNITLSGSNHGEQLVVGYALRISTDCLLSKAFTIEYYAPPLASNLLHHQWPRITTVDNNNSRRILILISLCSSMLATISQLPEEQMATKRKCFVVNHMLFIWFFIVSCRLFGSCGVPWGGFQIGSQMIVSAKSPQPPHSFPTHTIYTQTMLGCCQSQTWSQFSMRFQRARASEIQRYEEGQTPRSGWLFNYLRLIFNSWREE